MARKKTKTKTAKPVKIKKGENTAIKSGDRVGDKPPGDQTGRT